MKMSLNDPQTNWKFVGIVLVAGLVVVGLILAYV